MDACRFFCSGNWACVIRSVYNLSLTTLVKSYSDRVYTYRGCCFLVCKLLEFGILSFTQLLDTLLLEELVRGYVVKFGVNL